MLEMDNNKEFKILRLNKQEILKLEVMAFAIVVIED